MTGSVLISTNDGWVCSNEVAMIVERDLIKQPDGSMASKHTNTLRVQGFFKGKGSICKEEKVYCIFKLDSNNTIESFAARVSGMTDEMIVLTLMARTMRDEEIFNKIKQQI